MSPSPVLPKRVASGLISGAYGRLTKQCWPNSLEDPANAEFPNQAFVVAAGESPYVEPRPLTVGYLEYEEILSDAFEDIRNGADVADTLSQAAGRIQREMDKYRE